MAVLRSTCVVVVSIVLQLLATMPSWTQGGLLQSSVDFSTNQLPTTDIKGDKIHRSDFPEGFVFGTATSAYQVEGGAYEGGKGTSIWDTYAHEDGHISDGSNGDVADDQYHRFEEDIQHIADMNFDVYRFSIAWTRIFPTGTGEVSKEGVAYYNRLIDALLKKGIKPYGTLFHWDLPQTLQDSYSGWWSRQIVDDFAAYAEACFAAFGDRVKTWITFNEPLEFVQGYGGSGGMVGYPPGPYTAPSTGPYLAGHHVLLAHAKSVDIYRRKYQPEQGGVIGLAVDCTWGEPKTDSAEDKAAAERNVLFQIGWFLDPLIFGDYPGLMKLHIGNRLPQFTEEEKALLKGSVDYVGLNHYTSRWVSAGSSPSPNVDSDIYKDQWTITDAMNGGEQIGPMAASEWLYVVPWGIHRLVSWAYARYNLPIYITENGVDDDCTSTMQESIHDTFRVEYYQSYLPFVLQAIRDGVDIRTYLAWSLIDNFEWASGFNLRFGLVYVDYEDDLKRYPKDSARWFSKFLSTKNIADM